jgi:hypothetical protein
MENKEIQKINTYMIYSIICSVYCFSPFGMIGLYYSNKANKLIHKQNINEAVLASKKAIIWDLIGFLVAAVAVTASYLILFCNL